MARPRLSDATREKLLDAGVTMLVSRGYHGTGLKDLLDEVQVPKGSFYNYFRSKEDFGREVIRHYAERLYSCLDEHLAAAAEAPLTALRAYFLDAIEHYRGSSSRCGCLVGNLGGEIGSSSPLCQDAMAATMEGVEQRFARMVALGQQQGRIRDDIPAAELAAWLQDGWEGALIRMKVEGSVRPLERFVRLAFESFLPAP